MRTLFLSVLFFAAYLTAQSQAAVTLLTFESYTFADKFETEYGFGKIFDGFQWGGGFEFGDPMGSNLEIFYQRLDADAYYDGYNETYTGKVGANYIMIGGTRYAPMNDKVSGFGSFDLGVAFLSTSESLASDSPARFALGGRLGLRIQTSDKISFRVHAQLLSPVQWFGGGFYFGTGGSGAGVSTGSTIYQFNLGGSVNIRMK
jgi:hypothetical protein